MHVNVSVKYGRMPHVWVCCMCAFSEMLLSHDHLDFSATAHSYCAPDLNIRMWVHMGSSALILMVSIGHEWFGSGIEFYTYVNWLPIQLFLGCLMERFRCVKNQWDWLLRGQHQMHECGLIRNLSSDDNRIIRHMNVNNGDDTDTRSMRWVAHISNGLRMCLRYDMGRESEIF